MFVEGPVPWLLGMMAATLERWADAERHFEDALRRCSLAGMRPYEAIACLEYARMLTRQASSDASRPGELVRRGHAIASELGMAGVARELEGAERTPLVGTRSRRWGTD